VEDLVEREFSGFLGQGENSAQCLQASRVVRGKSAQHAAGEADFQCGAKNVGGWAGSWIPLEIVKVEEQARVKAYSRTRLEKVLGPSKR
jgi:hypothetical protein